jgi:hypothetical protein
MSERIFKGEPMGELKTLARFRVEFQGSPKNP